MNDEHEIQYKRTYSLEKTIGKNHTVRKLTNGDIIITGRRNKPVSNEKILKTQYIRW